MAEIMHIVLPYDLTEERILQDLEPAPHRPILDSLEWLARESKDEGELKRIFTSLAAMIEKGVDLKIALETAIVWERG